VNPQYERQINSFARERRPNEKKRKKFNGRGRSECEKLGTKLQRKDCEKDGTMTCKSSVLRRRKDQLHRFNVDIILWITNETGRSLSGLFVHSFHYFHPFNDLRKATICFGVTSLRTWAMILSIINS
jgi:hypothetical protein